MHPFLLETPWFPLRWYGVMVAMGILSGSMLARWRARVVNPPYERHIGESIFWVVACALLGARAWEVVFSWGHYTAHAWEALAFWQGGMSIQGGILGGLIAAVWYTRRHRLDTGRFLDVLAPGIVLGQGVGRIGCLLNGDAYGVPAPQGAWYGVTYAPGTPAYLVYGSTPLVPAEAFEGMVNLLIAGLLMLYRPKGTPPGTHFVLYVLLYSVNRFIMEFWRSDSLLVAGYKVAQLTSVAVVAVCTVIFLWRLMGLAVARRRRAA